MNFAYPTLEQDAEKPKPMVIGSHCPKPFATGSFFNISGHELWGKFLTGGTGTVKGCSQGRYLGAHWRVRAFSRAS